MYVYMFAHGLRGPPLGLDTKVQHNTERHSPELKAAPACLSAPRRMETFFKELSLQFADLFQFITQTQAEQCIMSIHIYFITYGNGD